MVDLGKYAFFVWASYGATLVVLGSLTALVVWDEKRQQKRLEELDREQGKS